ncbi:MAG: hypothetical protein IPP52_11555 [Ignavibacteria bacterium]|nr:hypothetical protein [Ignavibacteria bacterium]
MILSKPEWKDKIIIRNPMALRTMRVIYSGMIANSVKISGNESEGFEWLKSRCKSFFHAADPTQMYIKLSGNEAAVSLWNSPILFLQKTLTSILSGYNFPQAERLF